MDENDGKIKWLKDREEDYMKLYKRGWIIGDPMGKYVCITDEGMEVLLKISEIDTQTIAGKKKEASEVEEILEDLKCPCCGAYISFRTTIQNKRFNHKIECGKCLADLTVNIEVKEIKGSE